MSNKPFSPAILTEHLAAHVAELFRAFPDTSRVRIVSALIDGEMNISGRKTIPSVVLLIIACCLFAHFLVEDVPFQRAADSSFPGQSTAGFAVDETEHLDDLFMAARKLASIPRSVPPAVHALRIPLERQSAFPIRIPPKIA